MLIGNGGILLKLIDVGPSIRHIGVIVKSWNEMSTD